MLVSTNGTTVRWCYCRENSDGAVVRALASHQCGPGLIPGLDAICELSLPLVHVFV